ncbi:hypothetical protein Tco_0948643, partial [Tanacetum coccineum]
MFVDYMHQPWRTLKAIINKCLSGKTSSNGRLRKSRIYILWGMLHKKNVNFIELIWEDFQYQIDFRLKLIRIGEDVQEYGHKTRGKGPQENKSAVTLKKKSFISTNDNIIPEPDVAFKLGTSMSLNEAEKEEAARRVHATHERLVMNRKNLQVKKTLMNPLIGKIGRREHLGDCLRDTSWVSKKKSLDHSQKLKGIQVLTEEEQLAADTIQAIKGSNMVSRSQLHTEGSSEGAGITPEVPDESTVIFTTLSEGTGITLGVPDEVKGSSEAKVDSAIDWGSENKSDYSDEAQVDEEEIKWVSTDEEEEKQDDQDDDDDRSIDIEETGDDEKIDDEFVHGDEYVHDDVDEEMKD